METASYPLSKLIPNNFTKEDYQEGVKLITKMMTKSGVTSVTEAYGSSTFLKAYQDAYQADELSMRVYSMISYREIDNFIEAGIKTGFGDQWLRIGGMKITIDGSISERTAKLSKPYIGRPNDYGIMVMEEEEVYKYAHKAHTNGWQIGVHANGDVGIDKTLNIYERLQKEYPKNDPRFRLEHCTVINNDLVRRIKELNAIPNPFSTYVYFHGEKMKQYGKERLENMFAVRTFLDAGINVTQTSDYPPGPFEPMMALQSSVTRTVEDEITIKKTEAAIIDLIDKNNLTNKVGGYESSDFGRMDLNQINAKYSSKKANINEKVVLIKISQSFRYNMDPIDLYEYTRGIWVISEEKRKHTKYAFAVYDGVIQETYKIESWFKAGSTFSTRHDKESWKKVQRWEFVGDIDHEMRKKYLHKSVDHYWKAKAQNPMRYTY